MCCFNGCYESHAADGFFCAYRFPSRNKSDEGGGDNNSVWAIIAGISKNYVLPFDYVLYEMSFANVQMYNAVLPTYDSDKKDKKKKDKCRKSYGTDSPNLLQPAQKLELAKILHRQYNASNGQIRRMLKLDASIINELFPDGSSERK